MSTSHRLRHLERRVRPAPEIDLEVLAHFPELIREVSDAQLERYIREGLAAAGHDTTGMDVDGVLELALSLTGEARHEQQGGMDTDTTGPR